MTCAVWLFLMAEANGDGPLRVTGKVEAVTVYRGQALVSRTITVAGPAGYKEVVITGLPEHVIPKSIYAESDDGLVIRSVRYHQRPMQEDVREEVRKIDEEIRGLERKLQINMRMQALLAEQKAYLDKLEQFVAPTAAAELSRGVLNAETLKTLTLFSFEQREAGAKRELELRREEKESKDRQTLLLRQRSLITSGSSRTAREAVVFASVTGASGGKLRLRYLVSQATWTPSYNFRTREGSRNVEMEYFASVHQKSGEDWQGVAMTLSTATPSLVSKAPRLEPLKVTLAAPAAPVAGKKYKEARQELLQQRALMDASRGGGGSAGQRGRKGSAEQAADQPVDNFDELLNRMAGDVQVLDLVARGNITQKRGLAPRPTTEGVSVTYRIDGSTSLPSRDDRQLIRIVSETLDSDSYRLAIPVLTNFVYKEASMINTGDSVLLAGPVSSYLDGKFVGDGELPLVAVGERFTIGFGIDPSMRASRALVEKKESIQGGNRVVRLTYRLSVENFDVSARTIRLIDRLPHAKGRQIELTLVSPGVKLSSDSAYTSGDRKQGILRWDVEVPAKAIGSDAFANEFTFAMEYDKMKAIQGLPHE